ncbi:MAG TPA: ABC transporter ATP-binding protein [Polyangiaceae bacterium]|nr:ABC transporter ATP-binding protein [Polyangiaceae bacterium]
MSLLELSGVEKRFGGIAAIQGVSFRVEPKQIFGLIGPNGAGKTTLFNVVTGVYRPEAGRVTFDGRDVTGKNPAAIAEAGLGRTFQNIRLFRAMSVEQNVMVAGQHLHRSGLFDALLRTRRFADDENRLRRRAHELLELMGLRELSAELAQSLPYGSQRRLEIARALMLEPQLLLLDEPAAGMNSQEARDLERQLRFLRDQLGLSLILVEHNVSLVMSVCDHIHVVDRGRTIAEGVPDEIKTHPRVLSAYLGEDSGDSGETER